MKARLRAKERVRQGLLRIADADVELAIQRIQHPGGDRAEDVHAVRLTLKRLRAWWRLIRPVTDDRIWRTENQRLREAASVLAIQRDALVARQTLQALADHEADADCREALRRLLSLDCFRPATAPQDEEIEQGLRFAALSLGSTAMFLRRAAWSAQGWSALEPGLWRGYRRARQSARRLALDGPIEDYHRFRTRTKRLHFQLDLLVRAQPRRMRSLLDGFKSLGERLGRLHDLDVLRLRLVAHPSIAPRDLDAALRCIQTSAARLRRDSRRLGRTLLARKPRPFLATLRQRFERWHRAQEQDLPRLRLHPPPPPAAGDDLQVLGAQ